MYTLPVNLCATGFFAAYLYPAPDGGRQATRHVLVPRPGRRRTHLEPLIYTPPGTAAIVLRKQEHGRLCVEERTYQRRYRGSLRHRADNLPATGWPSCVFSELVHSLGRHDQQAATMQLPMSCTPPPAQTSPSWPNDGSDDSCPAAPCWQSFLSHARRWDPCPLSGLWLHLEGLINLICHRRGKISTMDTWKMLILLSHLNVRGAMLFNRLKYSESVWIGTRVPIFLKAFFDVLPGIQEGLLDPCDLHNLPGKGNTTTSFGLPRTTTSSVFRKVMGRMNFSRLIRYWSRDSGYIIRLYQIMRTQVNQLSVFKRISCLMMQW